MGRAQDEKSREKKLIRAPEDLVDQLNEAATRQGKTFYKYVTEIFEQALEAEKMNKTLLEIIESYKLYETSRKTGVAIVPSAFLDHSINQTRAINLDVIDYIDENELESLWHQTGKMYGLLLRGKFVNEIGAFIRLLKDIVWMVTDVEVKNNGPSYSLRFVTPSISEDRSHLLLKFIEGALLSLDYQILEKNDYKGIIDFKITPIS